MRFDGNFNPEWGYLAPAPSFIRTVCIVLVAAAVGAGAGAAVVFSLVAPPPAEKTVAARTLARPTDSAPAGSKTTQVQIPPSAPVRAPAKEDAAGAASGFQSRNSIIARPAGMALVAEAPAATDATPPPEPATAAPASQKTVARTIFDLTLRAAPDPHSEKVLENIPKDAVVELGADFPSGAVRALASALGAPLLTTITRAG
jgi:hypothetical protein